MTPYDVLHDRREAGVIQSLFDVCIPEIPVVHTRISHELVVERIAFESHEEISHGICRIQGIFCLLLADGMEDGRLYTITDIQKNIPACADLSNQRVSALVRQMVGVTIERTEDKRKAYFSKIAE